MRRGENRVGGDALLLTGLSVLSQILAFLYRVGLSRIAGAQVMGLYQLIMPVYSVLMSIAAVGITTAVSNLSARYLAVDNTSALRQTLRQSIRLFVCVMVPLALVTLALYDPISVYFLGDARTQLGLVLLLPCVALTGVENIHKHFFYGTRQVRVPALVELGEQVIRAGAVLGLLLLCLPQNPERTVGLIVTGMVLCEIFSSVTLVLLYRRHMSTLGWSGTPERPGYLRRRILSIAVPVGLNALLGNLLGAVNAVLVPKYLVSSGMAREVAVAGFGVLCGMTMPMLTLPCVFLGPLGLVMMPRIARRSALGQSEQLRRDVARMGKLVWVILLPCMVLMTVVGADLGQLIFKEADAGQYLIPLALATVSTSLESVLGGAVGAAGWQGTCAGINIVCDIVQLLLTVVCMGYFGMGMDGFVIGIAVSAALGLVLCILAARRHLGVRLHLGRGALIPVLGALLSWQTSMLLYDCLVKAGLSGWILVSTVLIYGAVVYLAALVAMGWRLREKMERQREN